MLNQRHLLAHFEHAINTDFHDSVHLNRSGKEELRELIFPVLTEKLTDQKSALIVRTKSGTVHDTNQ